MTIIDHNALGLSRFATQFTESTNIKALTNAFLNQSQELEVALCQLFANRWIATAAGVNLDIIGVIVGQPRTLIDSVNIAYFGFDDDPSAETFGDINDAGVGGRFRGVDEPVVGNRILIDDEYRMFIRTRIQKNKTDCSTQSIIDIFKFILGVDTEITITEGTTFYCVAIGQILTLDQKTFLTSTDLFPKPSGVGVKYMEYTTGDAFAFEDGSLASQGFGDVNDASVGGTFASLI